ncbi:hypothetical protein S83_035591, partial [Arachis hypogaea]
LRESKGMTTIKLRPIAERQEIVIIWLLLSSYAIIFPMGLIYGKLLCCNIYMTSH